MKTYLVRTLWDRNGNKYPMEDTIRVQATSVKAAVAKALGPAFKKTRKGWREPQGASFTLNITVLGTVEQEEVYGGIGKGEE